MKNPFLARLRRSVTVCSALLWLVIGHVSAQTVTIVPNFTSTYSGSLAGLVNGATNVARFSFPTGITSDPSGNLYVADYSNNVIRKISGTTVSTFAGSGVAGSANGSGASASFNAPTHICSDLSGNIYVADQFNHLIRKITPAGLVTTYAGDGLLGLVNGSTATARFNFPSGVAADLSGNVYVADQYNHVIRKISLAGIVTTLAGNGTSGFKDDTGMVAKFAQPVGVAVDASGNVYVADQGNNRIRKITPAGVVTTLAGTGASGASNGPGIGATFNGPVGVFADDVQNIYVADKNNQRIRKITPSGMVSTFAGSGTWGNTTGTGLDAAFANPFSITKDISGYFYIADASNNVVRRAETPPAMTFYTVSGTASAAQHFMVSGRSLSGNLLVTPLAGFEVSQTPFGTYSASLSLAPVNGEVEAIVYLRVKAAASAGFYNGSFTVSSAGAAAKTQAVSATVNGTPVSDFTYTNNSCTDRTVSFTDQSILPSSWVWNFGDGSATSSAQNPSHQYAKDSTYYVTLTINGSLVSGKSVTVATTPTVGGVTSNISCNNVYTFGGGPVAYGYTYAWTFSGGTGGDTSLFHATRSYSTAGSTTVKLTVTSGGRCAGVSPTLVFTPLQLTPAVVAALTITSANLCLNSRTLTNTSTAGLPVYTYQVDGGSFINISSGGTVALSSLSTGAHSVRMATNNGTCYDTAATIFYISVPTASFTATPNTCNQVVAFTNTSTTTDNGGMSYQWTFGASLGTSGVANPTFNYGTGGVNNATLKVTASSGCQATVVNGFTVSSTGGPLAGFTFTAATGACTNKIGFTNTTTGGTSTYLWNFGDGTTSAQANPLKAFGNAGNFTVVLTATSGACVSVASNVVNVPVTAVGPAANFNINIPTQLLTTNNFQCTNTSTHVGSGWIPKSYWYFGDGTVDSIHTSPNKTYATAGTFTITLMVVSSTGCTDSYDQQVTVTPQTSAAFSISNTSCSNRNATFTNTSTVDTSWAWDFGDGTGSTLKNPPVHTYTKDSSYLVKLTVNGLYVSTHTVVIATTPVVGTISSSVSCSNIYTFIGAPAAYGYTYAWTFAGGSGSDTTLLHPARSYTSTVLTTVNLRVTSQGLCAANATQLSFIPAAATAGVTAGVSVTAGNYCSSTRVITNTSNTGLSAYTYKLDAAPFTTIAFLPLTFNALANGAHTVKLATHNGVCFDTATVVFYISVPTASFTATPGTCNQAATFFNTSVSTGNDSLSYLWTFGASLGTSTNQHPGFNFVVPGPAFAKLKVTAASGCQDSVTNNFTIGSYHGPQPSFTWMPASGACKNRIAFTNTSTSTTGPLTYVWYFGDGTTSTDVNPFKTYADTGTFVPMLFASDGTCAVHTNLAVNVPAGSSGPIAGFSINTDTQSVTTNSYNFFNTSAYLGAGWINKSYWSFGDGTYDSTHTSVFAKTYSNAGTYTVTLTIVAGSGCIDVIKRTVLVTAIAQASFVVTNNSCANRTVQFNDASVLATSWRWDFGDGTPIVTSQNPSHLYAKDSMYTVTLQINGNSSSSRGITVATTPVTGPITVTGNCSNLYTFSGAPQGYNYTYNWTFEPTSTGSSTSIAQPTRSFFAQGPTNVFLDVTAGGRCSAAAPPLNFTAEAVSTGVDASFDLAAPGNDLCNDSRIITNTSTGSGLVCTYSVDGGAPLIMIAPVVINALSPGPHTITLIAGNGSCTDTAITRFTISTPVLSFLTAPGACDHLIRFANGSTATDNGMLTYTWTFGLPVQGTSTLTNPVFNFNAAGPGQATLTATSTSGCTVSRTSFFTVGNGPAGPVASFISDTVTGICRNQVKFTNTSVSGTSYVWDFGDGASSAQANPLRGYASAGTYHVTLTASNGVCTSTVTQPVTVAANRFGPSSDFGINMAVQNMTGNNFAFYNTSQYMGSGWIYKYYWSFGDGTIDSTHTSVYAKSYTTPGTYNVNLTAISNFGCIDNYSQQVTVLPVPVADFTAQQVSCLNRTVTFTSQSTLATAYLWNFGDGTSDTAANPLHTYVRDSMYQVTLTINGNITDTQTLAVSMNPPVGALTATPGCNNVYTFSGAPEGYGYRYAWIFSGGTGSDTTQLHPTRSYTTTASTTVRVQVTSISGCTSGSAVLNFTPAIVTPGVTAGMILTAPLNDACSVSRTVIDNSSGSTTTRISLDGAAFITISGSHTYSIISAGKHIIRLAASNGACADTTSNTFYISSPVASFTASPSSCTKAVSFGNGSATSDNGGMTYAWLFGSPLEGTSSLLNPQFTFAAGGSNSVTLMVTSSSGCTQSVTNTFSVSTATGGPVASFTADTTAGTCKNRIQFVNTSAGTGLSYVWNFGDGATSTQANPVRGYADTGMFNVTLIATNSASCSTYASQLVHVASTASGPSAYFTTNNPSQNLIGNSFNFINASKHLNGGWITKYYWIFGDGTVDSLHASVYAKTYTLPGTYTVTFSAISSAGCVDNYVQTIQVVPVLNAAFTYVENTCASRQVAFTDHSTLAATYAWDFGDGAAGSTLVSPTHTYAKDSTYKVTLTINGTLSTSQYITVATTPAAGTLVAVANCGNVYHFNGAPAGYGYTYAWTFNNGSGSDTSLMVPDRSYTAADTARVDLRVTSAGRCAVSAAQLKFVPNVISAGLVPGVTVTAPSGNLCLSSRIITNTSTGALTASYSLDGAAFTSISTAQTLTSLSAGLHTVRLAAGNGACNDTVSKSFYISFPTIAFTAMPNTCNQTVSFNNTSVSSDSGSMSYLWMFGSTVIDSSTLRSPFFNYLVGGTNTATLKVITSSGCVGTLTNNTISVSAATNGPVAGFVYAATGACKNKIQFTNTSSGTGLSYTWNFGDGTTSTLTNPSRGYADTGLFTVTLTTISGACSSYVSTNVHIADTAFGPSASFTINNATQLITSQSFNYTNTSRHLGSGWNTRYYWSVGDGSPLDSIDNSIFGKTYSAGGTYPVTLTATSSRGCTDSWQQQVTVTPVVIAKFGYVQNSCANRSVVFKDSSLLATSWVWNFGDGTSPSTLANPTHVYAKDSTYYVSLTINGTVVSGKTITVATTPAAGAITANADCKNVYTFSGAPAGYGYSYAWSFTGGSGSSTTLLNPTRSYTVSASTNVSLVITSAGLCANSATPVYTFNPNPLSAGVVAGLYVSAPGGDLCLDSRVITNTSNAGLPYYGYTIDGLPYDTITSAKLLSALVPGIHYVQLATTRGACTDTAYTYFYVSTPIASFTSTASSCNQVVAFTNTSTSSDNGVMTYQWKFGSPVLDSSNARDAYYSYPAPGTNTASLKVTSSSGCTASVANAVTVSTGSGSLAANFTFATVSGTCPNKIQFTNTTTGGSGLSYVWNFGDGTRSILDNPIRSFGDAGNFNVTLTAISGTCLSLNAHTINIAASAYGPSASFTISNPDQLITSNHFNYLNTSRYLNAGWVAKSYWSYGDGATDSVFSTYAKTYTAPGTYSVKLTVLANNGCVDSSVQTIIVRPVPTADFTFAGNNCSSRTVTFTDMSLVATSYFWNFGDGATSTLPNPVHPYTYDSTFMVTLTINGNVSKTKAVAIATTPSAVYTSTPNNCHNRFDFMAMQQGYGITYAWSFSQGTPSDTSSRNPRVSFTNTASCLVGLTVSSWGTCSATAAPLSVNSLMGVTSSATLTTADYCGTTRTLTNTSIGGTSFVYNLDNGLFAGITTPVNLTALGLGSHTIKMIGTDGVCADTASISFHVSSVTGSFASTPGMCDRSVAFTPTMASSDGSGMTYLWNFGGTDTSTLASPVFMFSSSGSKTVMLKATALSGCTRTVSNNVIVGTGTGPVSAFTASETKVSVCHTGFNFTGISPTATSYIWDFGDGNVSDESASPTIFHTYDPTGVYTVKLTAINAIGCRTVSLPQTITVTAVGKPTPLAGFYTDDSVECVSTSNFNFVNASQLVGSGWIASYKWDFGDGTFDMVNSSIFGKHYTAMGKYYVTLTATTNAGCTGNYTFPVRVVKDSFCAPPAAVFEAGADISEAVSLYPNPNNGNFHIGLNGLQAGSANVAVVDMLGRQVYAGSMNIKGATGFNFNDIGLATGKYYLIITTDMNQVARKPFAVLK